MFARTRRGAVRSAPVMNGPALLIGDLGGTSARFALAEAGGQGYTAEATLNCADFASAEEAIRAYLQQVGRVAPQVICLAVAGPVVGRKVRFLNNHWSLDAAALEQGFGPARARLMNDFEAVACAIPLLGPGDHEPIGPLLPGLSGKADFAVGVLGPGTGLGVSGLLQRDGHAIALVSEGGHTGFAPESQLQVSVLQVLREQFERVSDERLLSGPGVENIYAAMQQIHGVAKVPRSAAEIFAAASAHRDEQASETVRLFFEALGQAAGNLALTLGARDGVFVAGGIIRRYPELLKASGFRGGFENKGRHRCLLEAIPTSLIIHSQPGLLGASFMAQQMAARA